MHPRSAPRPSSDADCITEVPFRLSPSSAEPHHTATGDVVWTDPGVRHWHGATPDRAMTHIAVQEQVDGTSVKWLEPVTDEQYGEATP